MKSGKVFHATGPATANDLSPILVLVLGTKTSSEDEERSLERDGSPATSLILSLRYGGAML